MSRVENEILSRHICGEIFILPVLLSRIHVHNGLFEVSRAIHSAREHLIRAEARQEGLNIVCIHLDVCGVFRFILL